MTPTDHAGKGRKVLVLDLDAQANATFTLSDYAIAGVGVGQTKSITRLKGLSDDDAA